MQEDYLRDAGLSSGPLAWGARWMLERLRRWDARTAQDVGAIVANSHYVADRIRRSWGRGAAVVHPPVDTSGFALREDKEEFYLAASRLVPYKRMDVIVRAFAQMPQRRLVVIGDGPESTRLRLAAAPNVSFLGYQRADALRDHLQRARAFLFAAEEDFGIVPVEAQACGTPVIAFGRGGATESIRGLGTAAPTGVFFDEQTPEAVAAAVATFERERGNISPRACRENALRFGAERFRREMRALVQSRWSEFQAEKAGRPVPSAGGA
jgi:glycosyltransferase involved in cell wall biosynthesis